MGNAFGKEDDCQRLQQCYLNFSSIYDGRYIVFSKCPLLATFQVLVFNGTMGHNSMLRDKVGRYLTHSMDINTRYFERYNIFNHFRQFMPSGHDFV